MSKIKRTWMLGRPLSLLTLVIPMVKKKTIIACLNRTCFVIKDNSNCEGFVVDYEEMESIVADSLVMELHLTEEPEEKDYVFEIGARGN